MDKRHYIKHNIFLSALIAVHSFRQKKSEKVNQVPSMLVGASFQYSSLPKFLHHSWDGIGRTG
jgi:hypothetical protein